jgi:MerR family transcriptional regulator, light-induced transcriptional regulator
VPSPALRIGELSARVGVSPHVLRAWERRYGLLRPTRSAAGQRLYDAGDEQRVRRMLELMADGYGTGTAARLIAAPAGVRAAPSEPPPDAAELVALLWAAIVALDDVTADGAIDALLATYALDTVVGGALLQVLSDVGAAWQRGELTIAHEHFASSVIGGRMRALGRGWNQGLGPHAVLACPPGERHDLGLLGFALLLRARGWRITFLGADVPAGAIAGAADDLRPDVVVLAGARRPPLARATDALAALAASHRVALGGAGATRARAEVIGAQLLDDDPVVAADALSAAARASALAR